MAGSRLGAQSIFDGRAKFMVKNIWLCTMNSRVGKLCKSPNENAKRAELKGGRGSGRGRSGRWKWTQELKLKLNADVDQCG